MPGDGSPPAGSRGGAPVGGLGTKCLRQINVNASFVIGLHLVVFAGPISEHRVNETESLDYIFTVHFM